MSERQQVYVVDDDANVRDSVHALLDSAGFSARVYDNPSAFLADPEPKNGCVVSDIRMPGMTGLELQEEINRRGMALPVILITGHGDVAMAVKAMRAGAVNFLEKPFDDEVLLESVRRALDTGTRLRNKSAAATAAKELIEQLTPRERAVLDKLVIGRPNKVAAHELGISPRTVEIHRAHIMDKMNASSLSDLVRTVMTAEQAESERH